MQYPKNQNIHRPYHIYQTNLIYFVTGRTLNKIPFFNSLETKNIFIQVLNKSKLKYNTDIYAWALLGNHYHILFKFNNKFRSAQFVTPNKRNDEMSEANFVTSYAKYQLVEFIRTLHKDTARLINQLDQTPGRKIWYQYWDHCIRNEADFYKHFNYIHNNPIKHNKVKNLEGLPNYEFSSFKTWLNKKGKEWIHSCFEKYPIIDFTTQDGAD
jgi:putative transposase